MKNKLYEITNHFSFEGEVKDVRPIGEGLINDTYFVETTDGPDYILQRKNKNIFEDVPAMMDNIDKVTSHLRTKIEAYGGDPMRETMTLIRTKTGELYHIDSDGEYWTACYYIPDTQTFHVADSAHLAYEGGRGIGKFQRLLADMHEPLADILPGFHNMRFRYGQWDEAIKNDAVGRIKNLAEEIALIEKNRDQMLAYWALVEEGTIPPKRVTHNDTKISNILFDQKGDALCVIDLDTVLDSTCLNDYGDAIRSYCNPCLEDEKNLELIYFKIDIFEDYTKGYLSEAKHFLTSKEIEYLAFSAKYITFEQALRFLMDYINGDIYYRTRFPEQNLIRTLGQFKLLASMEENYSTMLKIVEKYI